MAKITVSGDVIRLLGDKGFVLAEPIRRKSGDSWETVGKNYFSVWCQSLPTVGDVVEVNGSFSAKLEEYQGKPQMKLSVNNATVTPVIRQSAQTAPEPVPFVDTELPF